MEKKYEFIVPARMWFTVRLSIFFYFLFSFFPLYHFREMVFYHQRPKNSYLSTYLSSPRSTHGRKYIRGKCMRYVYGDKSLILWSHKITIHERKKTLKNNKKKPPARINFRKKKDDKLIFFFHWPNGISMENIFNVEYFWSKIFQVWLHWWRHNVD